MTNFTLIPAGYRLSVTSWENDADNYQTEVLEGLTREAVIAYTELLKLIKKTDGGGLSNNSYMSTEKFEFIETFRPLMREHTELALFILEQVEEDVDDEEFADKLISFINDKLLGYSESYIMRVFESFKVEYIPHDIQLEDVTKEFQDVAR
jgi:hypothetical protein